MWDATRGFGFIRPDAAGYDEKKKKKKKSKEKKKKKEVEIIFSFFDFQRARCVRAPECHQVRGLPFVGCRRSGRI
jgi:hypothetical protein